MFGWFKTYRVKLVSQCKNCCGNCDGYKETRVVSSTSPTLLIDVINSYQRKGYDLISIWYRKHWFYTIFYAKVGTMSETDATSLDFKIGPVSNRQLV